MRSIQHHKTSVFPAPEPDYREDFLSYSQGVTFIPELALEQLSPAQHELVRPFALPIPVREVVLLTTRAFVRHSVLNLIADAVRRSVPQRMLQFNNTEQRV